MGRRPHHEKASRSAVVAVLAFAAAAVAIGGNASAQANPASEAILAAARATSVAAIEPGRRDETIVDSFARVMPDAISSASDVDLGDCGERSVPPVRNDGGDVQICAIVQAEMSWGGRVEVRFPIATAAGELVDDRSLHFAGVSFDEVERSFPSLEDFWSYVLNRSNLMNYWSSATQVVLVEVSEIQYVPNRIGHPNVHRRGRVLRSFRGDWFAGETIEVVTGTEGRPETFDSSDVIIPDPPELKVAFLNEHRAGPHYLDIGYLAPYDRLSIDLIVEDLSLVSSDSR
jgi:hypothetical protein